ncbi:hypothetical protein EJF18_60285 [Clavispora lusitaniae]|uniref:Uncharacterized protein n=1 Tax=Clavispora lusitaniae TaxID=36911 RepID=A0ACD0WQL4_CLALS|nr:hypothetical protein EJF14_60285 [Clavispora lusitaniae]QFZ35422.1 hypothetical protein EJF16_60285 [Clavispora lusitaniae]QFZ41116.1 hypothetical protein EJF15_60285 [Clavispora lusitaniae]QFZ46797.1 hypothetical protein EJF18_60285 [Clavispora lusitaniae]QFZ52462.1 hypothetical protein EJF17_60285 [Clavispora lusitaniae]
MELCAKGKPNGVEIFNHLGFGHVLLDVGHHLFGAIAPVGGS